MLRLASLLMGLLAALLLALPASAAERRVAVIQGDAELLRALALALSAWDVETIASAAAAPESSQPQAVLQASELARQLGVDGVVWIAASSQGAVLWVYDVRTGQATTRVLPSAPPFDSATAAGVALSVKTALRASVEPAAARPAPRPAAPEPPRSERVSLQAGLHAHFLADHQAQARLSLDSVVWLMSRRRLGLGLSLAGGPGISVSTASFVGRYRDLAFGPSAHVRWLAADVVSGTWFVGAAGHAALLDGTVTRDAERSSVKRYNVSVDTGLALHLKLAGGLYLGLGAQAAYLLAYQRYLVDGQPVFAPWRVNVSLGGHLGVALF